MKQHKALTVARRIAKQHGIETLQVGTLAMHVICREYHSRPLIIDLLVSSQEDKARFDICYLSADHPMYRTVSETLHGLTFDY